LSKEELQTETQERTEDLFIEDEMKDSYLTFAMSVIVSRALPDVRDGLKPSQRRIFVAMNDLNLGPRSKTRKCAKIVGDTHGNYHPHGDAAIYQTLARMAQGFILRYPPISGQGNFGSIDGDPPAAPRYTEARMTQVAADMLDDIGYNTVDFIPNYDSTREEPTVLPARFPNLLCNGSTGIAVGMATNIPPHNVTEICDALIHCIDNADTTIEDLLKIVKGPDFPTGGLICGRRGTHDAYRTGRGSVILRGRHHLETTRAGRTNIVFTEIPYTNNPDRILRRIADLVKAGTISGISDLRNESDRNGLRLVVSLRRGEEEEVILNQLFKHTRLQDTFGVNMIALVKGRPMMLNLMDMLTHYIEHRKDVVTRRTRFLLERDQARAHVLEGLLIALDNIDEVIEIIRSSPEPATAGERLSERFGLSDRQVKAILDMRLARLTGLERNKLETEHAELLERIAGYQAILDNEDLLMDVIREETFEIKERYGDKRRSELAPSIGVFDREDLIAEENVMVTFSHHGYIKRQPLTAYRQQRHGGKGIIGADHKEGDFTEHLFVASTHDYMLFFTDHGRVYWLKVYDIPVLGRTSRGRAVVNLLQLNPEEKITSFVSARDFSEGDLLMATEKGIIKRSSLMAYSRPKRKGIIAIRLQKGDRLISVRHIFEGQQAILATQNGMAVRFPEKVVRTMGRVARGVIGMRLKEDDAIVGLILAAEDATVLTVCENGFGKRTPVKEYRLTNRGAGGVINIKTTKRNGKVVGVLQVHDDDEVMIMTQRGKVIRSPMKNVRRIGRATQGVRVINVDKNDKVITLARIPKENEEENPEAESPENGSDKKQD